MTLFQKRAAATERGVGIGLRDDVSISNAPCRTQKSRETEGENCDAKNFQLHNSPFGVRQLVAALKRRQVGALLCECQRSQCSFNIKRLTAIRGPIQ